MFEEDDDVFLDYVLDDIPALAPKREMLWKRAQESDFLTIDEKRELVGREKYEPSDDPGGVILVEASKIPLAIAAAEEEEEEEEIEEETRSDLRDQGYTEEEIDAMLGFNNSNKE